ncbi:MAG TPA: ribosome biogenesis GTP-binding protein YihA/YsxC, partial [Gemmatimonadaceae bacterium]
QTPGRTREINFFRVNDRFVLADLPGYGYARISKERRAQWQPLIEGYLRNSPALRGVVQLMDVRHDPTEDDRRMLSFLSELEAPTVVVLTKIDKLRAREVESRVGEIASSLELEHDQVIPFSALTNAGRDELAEAVVALVEQPSWRAATAQPSTQPSSA